MKTLRYFQALFQAFIALFLQRQASKPATTAQRPAAPTPRLTMPTLLAKFVPTLRPAAITGRRKRATGRRSKKAANRRRNRIWHLKHRGQKTKRGKNRMHNHATG